MPGTATRSRSGGRARAGSIAKRVHYYSPGLIAQSFDAATEAPATLTVTALLFYSGKHTSMEGTAKEYKAGDLEKIVAATNAWMKEGRRVKIYSSEVDHSINQRAVVGYLASDLRLEEITSDKLPLPNLDALIGQTGIFAEVTIAGQENVSQYQDGRLKELSVGITPDNQIIEVSAVSIPALAGAALFSAGVDPVEEAFAAFDEARAYALTLGDQLQEDAIRRAESALWRLFDAFMMTLSDIRETADQSPDQLNGQTPEQLRAQAVSDLLTNLRAQLQIVEQAPAPAPAPVPLFSRGNMTGNQPTNQPATPSVEQFAALQTQVSSQERQLALFSRRETLSDRWSAARQKGEALKASGKMKPADFEDKFGAGKTVPQISTFGANLDEAEKAIATFESGLTGLEYYLDQIDKFGAETRMGLPVDPPLNEQTSQTDKDREEAKQFVDQRLPNVSYRN